MDVVSHCSILQSIEEGRDDACSETLLSILFEKEKKGVSSFKVNYGNRR